MEIQILHDNSLAERNIQLSVLRLDKMHPVISGNKLFKLKYFIRQAQECEFNKVITFGGAYSNHLVATAYASRQAGFGSVGIVRGEEPRQMSHTLNDCLGYGMHLEFFSRDVYREITGKEGYGQIQEQYRDHLLIPEGGFSLRGVRGAREILDFTSQKDYTHICCAIGSATTFAGLLLAAESHIELIGFPVLKNMIDIETKLIELGVPPGKSYKLQPDYHFGGYAKKTDELINFLNKFYSVHTIPLDFVYTGKMMFGINDLIRNNYFPQNSRILAIHTGGLQGNLSLDNGVLNF